ncbi:MAG: hypothetical protein LBC64_08150 [Fibromonadaceae bacterium]|jgi:RNase P subunit RPR2|nr:hypothetical protein [Fibromonadaceae bacterium]
MENLKTIYNIIISNPILSTVVAGLILAAIIGVFRNYSKNVICFIWNIIKWLFKKLRTIFCIIGNWFRIIFTINELEELVLRKNYRKQFIKPEFFKMIEYKRSLISKNHPSNTSKKLCRNCGRETLIQCGSHIFLFDSYEMPSLAYLCENCGVMNFYALVPAKLKWTEVNETNKDMPSLDGEI